MKILIDLQAAQTTSAHRGIGRYSLALIEALLSLPHHHEIYVALSQFRPKTIEPLRALLENFLPKSQIVTWQSFPMGGKSSHEKNNQVKISEQIRESFMASLKPDMLYVPSLFEGFLGDAAVSINSFEQLPTAMTLYDLIPLLCKETFLDGNPAMSDWYQQKLMSVKRADLWLAISEASRKDAIEHLYLPEEWVVNVSAAVSSFWKKIAISPEDVLLLNQKYHLTRPFVMCTGAVESHKNIKNLIEAYSRLPEALRSTHQLVVIGNFASRALVEHRKIASNCGLKAEEIVFTGFVPDDDLIKLYNTCAVFVCPSLLEGFGLPALEAMACGAAVIASNTSSLPEVIGYQDALFNPVDIDEIANKLHQVLTDVDFRKTLQAHGLNQSKKFSWDATAKKMMDAFERKHEVLTQSNVSRVYINNNNLNNRPRLAYISPFPPEKTGIANYSAELLPELMQHYSVDIITDQKILEPSIIRANCAVKTIAWFKEHAAEYQGRVLYHMGNSVFHQHMFELLTLYPGMVVLHDFFLSGILKHLELAEGKTSVWSKALYESHGYKAVFQRAISQDLEAVKTLYPCNFRVLQEATGVITHSASSLELAKKWYGETLNIPWKTIPLLRGLSPNYPDRKKIRGALGLKENDFVICSFGFLAPTKLNEELLDAWLDSPLSQDVHCRLVFVGENEGGLYGKNLLKKINTDNNADNTIKQRITITGFASEALYEQYLIAADVAVQLRAMSRGETSKAVLDCLAYRLPTILNAHGAMAEFPEDCVYKLPDVFSLAELKKALIDLKENKDFRENLIKKSAEYLIQIHHPRYVGKLYYEAIEHFTQTSVQQRQLTLMQNIMNQSANAHSESSVNSLYLAEVIVQNEPLIHQKQLFIDLSELVKKDLKTGIERVVRGYLNELLKNPPEFYRVEPIYCDAQGNYRYARSFTTNLLNCPQIIGLKDDLVEVYQGDIFLSIDLVASDMKNRMKILKQWRDKGALLYFVVYDLLAIRNPQYFPPGMDNVIADWLKNMVMVSDGAVCISRTVAEDLKDWLNTTKPERQRSFNIGWTHLAADIKESFPTTGCSEDFRQSLVNIQNTCSILMVGTIEPRKGHNQVLAAFELLWKKGATANLIIVGKTGWQMDDLIKVLKKHPENNKQLFWFEKASDEVLLSLYQGSKGCIMASNGEGFGLPLIEAAQYELPILVRDIPVFREVAGEFATYFSGSEPEDLASALEIWIKDLNHNKAISSMGMPWMTWTQSTQKLLDVIFGDSDRTSLWELQKCF